MKFSNNILDQEHIDYRIQCFYSIFRLSMSHISSIIPLFLMHLSALNVLSDNMQRSGLKNLPPPTLKRRSTAAPSAGTTRWRSASCVSNGRISACTLPSTGVDRSAPGCMVNYYNVVVHRVVYQVVEPYLKDSGHS